MANVKKALAAGIAKAGSRLEYTEAQLARAAHLARQDFTSRQALDQANVATARADMAEAEVNHAAAEAGPTRAQRAIAEAQVEAAAAALAVIEPRGWRRRR